MNMSNIPKNTAKSKHDEQERLIAEAIKAGVPYTNLDKAPQKSVLKQSCNEQIDREQRRINWINHLKTVDEMSSGEVKERFKFTNPLDMARAINRKAGCTVIAYHKKKVGGYLVNFYRYGGGEYALL